MTKTMRQQGDNIVIIHLIDVTAEQIQKEPVAVRTMVQNDGEQSFVHRSIVRSQQKAPAPSNESRWMSVIMDNVSGQILPERVDGDDGDSIQQSTSGSDQQEGEQKPNEKVDFFVENVERQQTQIVVRLNVTRRTESIECTFGQFGKHSSGRADVVLVWGEHVVAVHQKLALQKLVGQIDFEQNVRQVDRFTDHEFERISIVVTESQFDEFDDFVGICLFGIFCQNAFVHIFDQKFHLTTFPNLSVRMFRKIDFKI